MIMPGTAIEGGGGSRDSSEFEFISKVTNFLKMLVLRTLPPVFRFNEKCLSILKELTQTMIEYIFLEARGE